MNCSTEARFIRAAGLESSGPAVANADVISSLLMTAIFWASWRADKLAQERPAQRNCFDKTTHAQRELKNDVTTLLAPNDN